MRVGQRRAGRETFGGVAGESRHPRFLLDTLGQDLRFAGRQIARWPGFALLVVATLAVGIGANVAIFSVLEGVVFRPLPYSEPERLLAVWETPPEERWYQPFSAPDYLDVREQSRTLEEIGVLRARWFNVAGGGGPERIRGAGCWTGMTSRPRR